MPKVIYDTWKSYIHIPYKAFRLLMWIKSNKSIIKIAPINVWTKKFWDNKKAIVFQNDEKGVG